MERFSAIRLGLAAGLFIVLVGIALFAPGGFVRGTLGDVLVVVFLFLLVRALTKAGPWLCAAAVFAFACVIEACQAFNLVETLGLADNALARIVIGTHASWADLAAYAFGALVSAFADRNAIPRN